MPGFKVDAETFCVASDNITERGAGWLGSFVLVASTGNWRDGMGRGSQLVPPDIAKAWSFLVLRDAVNPSMGRIPAFDGRTRKCNAAVDTFWGFRFPASLRKPVIRSPLQIPLGACAEPCLSLPGLQARDPLVVRDTKLDAIVAS